MLLYTHLQPPIHPKQVSCISARATQAMAIAISPLTEDEIPAFVRVELEAFRSHPRIPMLWRRGYTEDLYAYYEATKLDSFRDPETRFVKATDEHGKIVAVSQWQFVLHPHKGTKPIDPNGQPPSNWPFEGNWELRRFFQLNTEKWVNESLAGRSYISECGEYQTSRSNTDVSSARHPSRPP